MTDRKPANLDAQLVAARELYAQAQAGCMGGAAWPEVTAIGPAETTVHVIDHALRRLVYVAINQHDAAEGQEVVAALLMLLGEHMGQLAATLGPDLMAEALPVALKTAAETAGARAVVSTFIEPTPQQKEVLH